MIRMPMYETDEAAREGVGLASKAPNELRDSPQLRRAAVAAPSDADVQRARTRLLELAAQITNRQPA